MHQTKVNPSPTSPSRSTPVKPMSQVLQLGTEGHLGHSIEGDDLARPLLRNVVWNMSADYRVVCLKFEYNMCQWPFQGTSRNGRNEQGNLHFFSGFKGVGSKHHTRVTTAGSE